MPGFNIDSTYGVVIIQDLNVVNVDENYAKIYGYDSAAELLESIESFLDLIPKTYHQAAVQNYHDTIAGTIVPRGHTFKNVDRHGREFTVFSVDHVIKWQGRDALQVTVIDLSIVVEAQNKLREQEQAYRQLIMNSGQGIMVHRQFKPLMLNQAWVNAMHAESIEQVMALDSILEVIPPEDRLLMADKYDEILQGKLIGKSKVVENICFDGKRRFFNVYDNVIEWQGESAVQVVIEDCTDKVEYEKALAYKATHDGLTDLYNRSAINEWLSKLFYRQRKLFCLLIDIDDFKLINDRYGHQTGDVVIQSIAKILKKQLKLLSSQGAVGRWGGEEFIVFLTDIDETHAREFALSITQAFARSQFEHRLGEFNATTSIGVSVIDTELNQTRIDELVNTTDKYLYLAKARGKNRVVSSFDPAS
ncbi:sensor domain-containing diguanylate cyclase [Shewanella maritima]|uniref:diguanylate cyclase n=1 Tax=Shewanella maritima TaxID=2520507 RepID=A0A411PCV4_9GAMM|nr:sensor domain-containing diguanylate cyclase [Shewanella maritima]QBF81344.1 sensor domain-containing diguanylate cyclase [Shewanella maritima]